MSKLTGTNMAIANMLILLSDITMLLVCMWLYQNGQIGFDGFLIPMIALMSSFGPVTALAALGTTLQSTVASGARVLEIIDEEPETEDITGRALFAVILWNSLLFSNTFISIIYPHIKKLLKCGSNNILITNSILY